MSSPSVPVNYIEKSRIYYEASGYEQPYRWASNDDAPFAAVSKPISQSRIAVMTTSYPVDHSGPKEPYAASTSPIPSAMNTDGLFWDRDATHTNDVNSFLPLGHLQSLADQGHIGSVAPRFFGAPTAYSQGRSRRDGRLIADWAAQDDVDLLLLFPL